MVYLYRVVFNNEIKNICGNFNVEEFASPSMDDNSMRH